MASLKLFSQLGARAEKPCNHSANAQRQKLGTEIRKIARRVAATIAPITLTFHEAGTIWARC